MKQEPTALASTLIDKSVTLRNSMDLNRNMAQAQGTSSGPDFNARATNTTMSASMQQTLKKQETGSKKILALNFCEVVLANR